MYGYLCRVETLIFNTPTIIIIIYRSIVCVWPVHVCARLCVSVHMYMSWYCHSKVLGYRTVLSFSYNTKPQKLAVLSYR